MRTNLEIFLETYKSSLKEAREKKPSDYLWSESEFDAVYGRMASAIERGSFNKESPAFKITCKKLNLKHTYTAIEQFINLK